MPTTAMDRIPVHVVRVQEKAAEMGWDAERTLTSLKITPPKGSSVKSFSVSLTKPPVQPQLNGQLARYGFNDAYAAWKRENGGEEPEGQPQQKEPLSEAEALAKNLCPECLAEGTEREITHRPAMAVHRRAKHGVEPAGKEAARQRENNPKEPAKSEAPAGREETNSCPECAAAGTPSAFGTAQGLGSHRRRVHDVEGTSPEAIRRRELLAENAETVAKKAWAEEAPEEKAAEEKAAVPAQRSHPVAEDPHAVVTPRQQPVVGLAGLPDKVGAAISELVYALGSGLGEENAELEELRRESELLRDFRDQVSAEVSDGNKPPLLVVASIFSLLQDTQPKPAP